MHVKTALTATLAVLVFLRFPNGAQVHAQPAAAESDQTLTMATLLDSYERIERDVLLRVYHASDKTDKRWDDDVAKFFGEAARWVVNPRNARRPADLAKDGDALLERGCSDAAVTYLHALVADNAESRPGTLALLKTTAERLHGTAYPKRYLANTLTRTGLWHAAKKDAEQARESFEAAAALWPDALKEMQTANCNPRYSVKVLAKLVAEEMPPQFAEIIVSRIVQDEDVDRWTALVLEGFFYFRLAWAARGDGWAQQLKEEQIAAFGKHLASTRKLLVAAYELAPDRPEPCSEMIQVAMAEPGRDEAEIKRWFDNATRAQFDWDRAYTHYMWALRPRWGGSHQQMLAFGQLCRNTERFDTAVPSYFYVAIRDICEDRNNRFSIWQQQPQLFDIVQDVLEKTADQCTTQVTARWARNCIAAAAWCAGRPADGYAALEKLDFEYNWESFGELNVAHTAAVRDLCCFGGPAAQTFEKIWAALADRNTAAAARIAEEAVQSTKDSPDFVKGHIRSYAATLRDQARFESGEWVDVALAQDGAGWRVGEGRWDFSEDGKTLTAHPSRYSSLLTSWVPFGSRWELEYDVTLPMEKTEKSGFGVVFGYEWRTTKLGRWQSVIFNVNNGVGRTGAGTNPKNAAVFKAAVKPDEPNNLNVRLEDDLLTVSLNGERLYSGPIPPANDGWTPADEVGLWGPPGPGGDGLTFKNVRIRMLPQDSGKNPVRKR